MDYSKFGVEWANLWTQVAPEDSKRLEDFMTHGKRVGLTNWWGIEPLQYPNDLFVWQRITSVADPLIAVMNSMTLPEFNIRLNATGGLYCEMKKIIEAIQAHPSTINTVISGFVGSAVSVIAMSGAKVYAAKDAFFMIHGSYPDPELSHLPTQDKEECDVFAAGVLHKKSGIPKEVIRDWMQEERLFTARESLQLGFVDELLPAEQWCAEENIEGFSFLNALALSVAGVAAG